jgi:Protein-arginine deiminase (PAD)
MRCIVAMIGILWAGPSIGQVIDLDGDTDRDGVVCGTQAEEELEGKTSVLVINNCDRDGPASPSGKPNPDNQDNVINGSDDCKDLEPVYLRKLSKSPRGKISLRLRAKSPDGVGAKHRVRIFKDDGTMILGPSTSMKYVLSNADARKLLKGDLKFLVEGLAFATSAKLSVYLDEVEQDCLILEVAPFLLVPYSQAAEANYVVKVPDDSTVKSSAYVDGFRRACFAAGVRPAVMSATGDVWIEDEMSWGYSETPRVRMPVVLHLYRLCELKANVRGLLGPGVGYATIFDYGPDPTEISQKASGTNSINYGGNLEVTPPTPRFPFGRVYYGSIPSTGSQADDLLGSGAGRQIDPRYQAFFKRQNVQPPIDLNTDWLFVGHVDELITFLPKAGGGFELHLASPQLALDIVKCLPGATALDPKYDGLLSGLSTASDLLSSITLGMTLEQYNEMVDMRIFGPDHASADRSSVKGRLKVALGLDEADIYEVPVLFYHYIWNGSEGALALTPGMVNLNSMGGTCLVPEPFLDPFKSRFSGVVASFGQCPVWIDDWTIYHANCGEVHCGSNTRRQPFKKKWWTP